MRRRGSGEGRSGRGEGVKLVGVIGERWTEEHTEDWRSIQKTACAVRAAGGRDVQRGAVSDK